MQSEDLPTASKIAKILELLSDGQWHKLEEIQQKARLNEDQTHHIVEFLKKYSFVILDESCQKVQLEKMTQLFLTETVTS